MSAINAADRVAIERGMMSKTNHKERIDKALAAVGADLMKAQRAAIKGKYGGKVVKFIETMPPDVRGYFCQQIERSQLTGRRQFQGVMPSLYEALDDRTGAQYIKDVIGSRYEGLSVRFPQAVTAPIHAEAVGIRDILDAKSLQTLDREVSQCMATAQALRDFLFTVRTTQQLQESMPEALAFVVDKAKLPAVVIDASNALAALSRAGAFEDTLRSPRAAAKTEAGAA